MMYTASTAANRLRTSGRTGRRVAAALVAAAALGLGVTACGQGDGSANGAGSSNSANSSDSSNSSNSSNSGSASASQHDSASSATSRNGSAGGSSNSSAAQGHSGSESAPEGSGVANAGNHRVIVGKMSYLAPGKLLVKPEDGGKAREFDVSNAVEVRGAAAICGGADGSVKIGEDGYGTKRCTGDQLEKAAKTGSVVVRVTMEAKSDIPVPDLIEEKYHP
ncbi:hypothetical protein AB0I49_21550 [Streptomyces sp. NPDC050617]|uniref:hypothetical protein n=1 Tax=Streptomyces sp. NPDC050617 TaxID=3154628 RepID=UPI00344A80BC